MFIKKHFVYLLFMMFWSFEVRGDFDELEIELPAEDESQIGKEDLVPEEPKVEKEVDAPNRIPEFNRPNSAKTGKEKPSGAPKSGVKTQRKDKNDDPKNQNEMDRSDQDSTSSQTVLQPRRPDPVDKPIQPEEKSQPSMKKSNRTSAVRGEPVRLRSDGLKGSRTLGEILLRRNVRINQGDLEITCDEATVFFDASLDELERVVAKGSVKLKKLDEVTGKKIRAFSDKLVYLPKNSLVTLSGRVSVTRGDDVLKGRVIEYDMNSGWITGKKVDGLVQPNGEK